MSVEYPSRFNFLCLTGFGSESNRWPGAVTTFPGGEHQTDPFEIGGVDRFDLVDVSMFGKVVMSGGVVEFLDASDHSAVTVTGGTVHFLESGGASTVNILGGGVEYLSVSDRGLVRIFGSNLRLIGDRVTGELANGCPAQIILSGSHRGSVRLLPPPATHSGFVPYDVGRWGRAG